MIRASRRAVVLGALALPVAARASGFRLALTGASVVLYDPALESGRRLAQDGHASGDKVLAIEGDRIRFAREVFGALPASVRGISRQADFVLIDDVAREAGYRHEPLSVDGSVIQWRFISYK